MELWLDTINPAYIQHALDRFPITGITTNPSILSHTTNTVDKTINELLEIQPGFVAVQLIASDETKLLAQAFRLAQYSERIILKVPVTDWGLKIIRECHERKIQTMATAIFTTTQFYLAMRAGATYAAPYFGRIVRDKLSEDLTLHNMLECIRTYQANTKMIAAAINTLAQAEYCIALGVHAITLPENTYQALVKNHPATEESLDQFTHDWQQVRSISQSFLFNGD